MYDCVKKKCWKFYYVYFPNEGCRINWRKYEFGLQYILFCFTIFKGLDLQTYAMGMTMKKLLDACYRLGQEIISVHIKIYICVLHTVTQCLIIQLYLVLTVATYETLTFSYQETCFTRFMQVQLGNMKSFLECNIFKYLKLENYWFSFDFT